MRATGAGATSARKAPTSVRRRVVSVGLVFSVATATASCAPSGATTPRSAPTTAVAPTSSMPASSANADTRFYLDVATADPALSSYVDGGSTLALRAILADGVALCDVLDRGKGIDDAMMSVAAGADSVESLTHLPRSVRTFNSIDSAALLTLCPGDQRLLPAAARTSLHQLAGALAASQSGRQR